MLFRDLGVHVDGFIANVAHSFVVGASKVRAFQNETCSSVPFPRPLSHPGGSVFIAAGEPHHRPES